MSTHETYKTVVIGGGQAGLAAGYYLSSHGGDFVILDENEKAGASWRKRWDSLRLFTPTLTNHLPGMKFAKPDYYFPTKDETANYLTAYAEQFKLPIQFGMKVNSLTRNGAGYKISAGEQEISAKNVIVATGAFQSPFTPTFANELNHGAFQMHSVDYHNPGNIPGEKIVVVGAANSGSEIALELAQTKKKVWLAGRDVGRLPIDKFGKILHGRPLSWFMRHVMTDRTPVGRKMKQKMLQHGHPLGRAKREELIAAGVELTPRIAGVKDGSLYLEDGRNLQADGIIWATGFRPDYRWISLPIFDATGQLRHVRGVVTESPGLYFLGLIFQSGVMSSLLGGVGDDARNIVKQIV